MKTLNETVLDVERFSPVDRLKIIDKVIRDTLVPDPSVEKVWAKEAARRWSAYKDGKVDLVSYEDAMSKYASQ